MKRNDPHGRADHADLPLMPRNPIELDPMNPVKVPPPDTEAKPAERPDLDWAEHED
jgi:hypothetical protein